MFLRINGNISYGQSAALQQTSQKPDSWSDRIVKLIPAESLGLYGTGSAIVPDDQKAGLWILVAACLILTIVLRHTATKDEDGKPQFIAICISIVSLLLWLTALSPPVGPFDLGPNAYLGALLALIWGVLIPAIYKGK